MVTFLVVVMLQTLVCTRLTGWIISWVWSFPGDLGWSWPASGGTRAFILSVEIIYQTCLVVDAGRRKKLVKIVGICPNNVGMLIMTTLANSSLVRGTILTTQVDLHTFEVWIPQPAYLALMALPGACSRSYHQLPG